MRTRQGETFDWGYGFALPRLPSRPQEGSGEECGRVSDWGFSEISKIRRQSKTPQKQWNDTYDNSNNGNNYRVA